MEKKKKKKKVQHFHSLLCNYLEISTTYGKTRCAKYMSCFSLHFVNMS